MNIVLKAKRMKMKPIVPEGNPGLPRPRRRVLFFLLFIFVFSSHSFAQDRIIDNAGLLDPTEKTKLMQMTASVASAYDFDLVIVTEKNIGNKKAMDYADDFFDYNGYGLGGDRDGCLFLYVTEAREYWFSTSGRGIEILNSTAFDKLEADTVKFLKSGNPFEACRAFILDWEIFLELDAKGRSFNFFHQWNMVLVAGAWLVAVLIGFSIVAVWKRAMNTALPKTQAAAYIVKGSLDFTEKRDRFLYTRTTKTKRQKQSSGGSGTHTGSSGRRHGGGGGRF